MNYLFYGVDDGLVPRAATVIAGDMQTDFLTARCRSVLEEILRRQQHPRGAEAALQGVALMERLLQGRELLRVGEALDGVHPAAVRLDREHQAADTDLAVDA